MKKLLIIHNGYPLKGDGGDKIRTFNMIQSLERLGFSVFFIAFYKRDFAWLKYERKKIPYNIKAYFIFTLPDRFGFGGLAALQRALLTWFFVKFKRIDVVHLETSLSATCVRFLPKNMPVVIDFHADPVPELLMNNAPLTCVNRARRDVCYALLRAQKLIAVSENLSNNLKDYFNYVSPISILPCSFKWQCIEETLDIFAQLREKDPRYFLCLYTNDDLNIYATKLKSIGNDCLCKSLAHDEVPLYLSIVDAGFVLRQNSLVNINASPTKIAEYMAVGAMVIATRYSGDAWEMIEKCGYGVLLDELENASDETISFINDKIQIYLENKIEASSVIKECVLKNRLWQVNENKLRKLYSEM